MAIDTNRLRDKWYRMDNLYRIIDKDGNDVQFRMNAEQSKLAEDLWYLNLILKARQLGFTTFVDLYFLDECLFNPNVEAGVIAHTKADAMDIFRRKFAYPYEHLDSRLKAKRRLVTDSASKMGFSNGSTATVGTSFRSGTLQYLHVSELGKIAKKYPEKAREIVTGALEAVGTGNTMVFIEGTGEGKSGVFFDMAQTAQKLVDAGQTPGRMDYAFHFFPWWVGLEYELDEPVAIVKDMQEYFEEIESKTGQTFTPAQKAWYVKKRNQLGEDIFREYPSTPEEAFESGIEGTYFRPQFVDLRKNGQICSVPHQDGVVVDTWWDLGWDDYTSIWFTQDVGREIHLINYYENHNEGLEHYRDILDAYNKDLNYRYGRTVGPHDIEVHELGPGCTRLVTARKLGMNMEVSPKIEKDADGIQASRSMFPTCWFDEVLCGKGLEHLEEFRKEWDAVHGVWKASYVHDEHAHGYKAFETLAVGHDWGKRSDKTGLPRARARKVVVRSSAGWT